MTQTLPILLVCGGYDYEELHRNLHDEAMRCLKPREFIDDMLDVLRDKKAFSMEMPNFIYDVQMGVYVDHKNHYVRFGGQLEEFSKTLLSNLAIDSRNTLIRLRNKLINDGYYNNEGMFPYVLQDYTDRALSFKPHN